METVKSLFERLQYDENRLAALLDGKTYLVNVKPTTLKGIITAQDIALLFACFDTQNEEQISAVIFILKLLLPIVDVGAKLEVLSQNLWNGLNHSNSSVQHLCLGELRECCVTNIGNRALMEGKNVIAKVIELIGDDDMSIAHSAVQFLSDFASYSINAAKFLLQGELLEKFQAVMRKNDNVRYRGYDVIVKIQSKSIEHLSVCDSSGLLRNLVNELMGDDVLIKVVCVSTLSEMALRKHSLQYLNKNGVVNKLISMITNAASDPLADLYMPEIVKFFGKMSYQEGPQHVIQIFPQFLDTLFSLVDEFDLVKKKIGIETLGFIGQSMEGKNVLAKEGNRSKAAVTEIGKIICTEGSDLRLISINAMCQLLDIAPLDQTEDIVALLARWFRCISSSPIDAILFLCRQPFTSVKCAGFHLIKTIAKLEFGMAAMVEFPTFVEFILDRSSDNNKESKDARFEAVKAIAESPQCMHIFGNNNYLKFRSYVLEGPLYEEMVSPEVAMETS
uniref:26S proteasome non-ATPase regulatory subunit 5-like n=1 Tax=Styela clava TaxID=7725 RepID=UPI001939AC3A|nr:26S proteasome non-ATPase regulatory subunit 5-like [Styela clava]